MSYEPEFDEEFRNSESDDGSRERGRSVGAFFRARASNASLTAATVGEGSGASVGDSDGQERNTHFFRSSMAGGDGNTDDDDDDDDERADVNNDANDDDMPQDEMSDEVDGDDFRASPVSARASSTTMFDLHDILNDEPPATSSRAPPPSLRHQPSTPPPASSSSSSSSMAQHPSGSGYGRSGGDGDQDDDNNVDGVAKTLCYSASSSTTTTSSTSITTSPRGTATTTTSTTRTTTALSASERQQATSPHTQQREMIAEQMRQRSQQQQLQRQQSNAAASNSKHAHRQHAAKHGANGSNSGGSNSPHARRGSNSTGFFKLKNFMYSKMATSKLGRKVIKHLMGDAGDALFTALETSARMFAGRQPAHDMSQLIIKFAIKGKLLHDARRLTQKDVIHLSDPVNMLVLQLHENLQGRLDGNEDNVDVPLLNRSIMRLYTALATLLQQHVSAASIAKLRWLFGFVGDTAFLTTVLNEQRYQKQRAIIHTNLGILIAPLIEQMEAAARNRGGSGGNTCKHKSCQRKPLQLGGVGGSTADERARTTSRSGRTNSSSNEAFVAAQFRHLGFCEKHHFKTYLNLLTAPSVRHFLEVDTDCEDINTLLAHALPPNFLPLWRGCGHYQRAKWNVRKIFAQEIYRKYFLQPVYADDEGEEKDGNCADGGTAEARGGDSDVVDVDRLDDADDDEKTSSSSSSSSSRQRIIVTPGATHPVTGIPPDCMQQIEREYNDKPTPDTYTSTREFVTACIERVFDAVVLPSVEYRAYMRKIRLPDYITASYGKKYAGVNL